MMVSTISTERSLQMSARTTRCPGWAVGTVEGVDGLQCFAAALHPGLRVTYDDTRDNLAGLVREVEPGDQCHLLRVLGDGPRQFIVSPPAVEAARRPSTHMGAGDPCDRAGDPSQRAATAWW